MDKKAFKRALKAALPIVLGYIPASFAFGLMLTAAGFKFTTAIIMSIIIYTGAGQYLAVGFFINNVSLLSMAITTFLVNSKHMFYGLSLLKDYKNAGMRKPYLIFSLTDETYAVLTGSIIPEGINKLNYMFYVSLINHCSWITGTILGSVLGSVFKFNTKGLDFAMTALFLVIVIEQLKVFKTKLPFFIGAISALIAWVTVGKSNMLLGGALLSVVLLIIFRKKIDKIDN